MRLRGSDHRWKTPQVSKFRTRLVHRDKRYPIYSSKQYFALCNSPSEVLKRCCRRRVAAYLISQINENSQVSKMGNYKLLLSCEIAILSLLLLWQVELGDPPVVVG